MKSKIAKVLGRRSQMVRSFEGDTVVVPRNGGAVILEPAGEWPDGYVDSFIGIPEDFERPQQGDIG